MQITTGKQTVAQRAVIYGPEGIGKSTLGSQFPKPVFIDVESGTSQLNVSRTDKPTSWSMLLGIVGELTRDHHGFETVVIDTADSAERLCLAHVCAVGQKESIEDFGYGKGFTKMGEEWNKLLNSLTQLRDGGMNIVLLAHSYLRKFEQPDEFGAYDRYEMKLSKQIAPVTKEWADMVLFLNYETIIIKDEKTNSAKAAGGQRVIHTEHHVCWDAKNRHGLPSKMEFSKNGFFSKLAGCFPTATGTPPRAPEPKAEAAGASIAEARHKAQEAAQAKIQEMKAVAKKEVTQAVDSTAFHPALYDLMTRDGITDAEIQNVVAKRGYFPADTPLHNYPTDFVNGSLVACWEKVKGAIIANRTF